MGARTPRIGPGVLLGLVIAAAAAIVACLVLRAVTGVPAVLVVAIAALVVATAGMARVTAMLLSDGNGGGDDNGHRGAADDPVAATPRRPRGRRRWTALAVPVVAATAVAPAVVLPHADARATAQEPATPATARGAVRDFLADSVLEDNAYAACGYLTPAAQQRITLLAGEGQSCRDALNATRPSFGGIASEGDLHALRLTVAMRGRTAAVRATPMAGRAATFVLRPASATATDPYRAPRCAWRIAAGETAVLPGAPGGPGT
jgi:hypothetical protein